MRRHRAHYDVSVMIAYNLLSLTDNLITGSQIIHTKGGLLTLSSPPDPHDTSINRPTTNNDKGSATQRQLTFNCLTCQVIEMELGIELGRHQKPRLPVERRLCIFCNSRKSDHEMHFLIHCEFHTNARKTFFSAVYNKSIVNFESLNDKDKFRAILIFTNEAVIFTHGKFIHDGLAPTSRQVIVWTNDG